MLKRIHVNQLVIGMHVKEFCGSWMDHPFWRSAFVVKDAKELNTILASSIKEVWIDTDKGLDVSAGAPVVTQAQSDKEVDALLMGGDKPTVKPIAKPAAPARTSAQAELAQAAKICAQGKKAVMTMFQEARMGKTVDAVETQELVQSISDSVGRNANALISLARLKTADDYTFMHSVAVCAMMVALGRQLNLTNAEVQSAGMAGLLHDLGKALMPMQVLNKPGKLTEAEFAIIRTHPEKGHKLLVSTPGVDPIAIDVCLHHHEKMDGSGYPMKQVGEQISLYSRMGAVCDVYDAITSNRPYKNGWDPAESLRKMAEWQGHFDAKIFQAFVKSLGIYPMGSLVRLTSGRIGVVIEPGRESLTRPSVKVFYSTKSSMRITPVVIDLAGPGVTEKIVAREDPAVWHFPDLDELWSGLMPLN